MQLSAARLCNFQFFLLPTLFAASGIFAAQKNVVKIHPRNTVQDLVGQIWTTSLTLILEYVEYLNVVKWILVVSSTHSLAFVVYVHMFSFYFDLCKQMVAKHGKARPGKKHLFGRQSV